uniref:HDC07243 n=1 Tax=Drosophila melanogaster TaxID=7227 RepID=Q6IG46_DROME|nr:TPA_inf: HDC07243 [Drosophila melanogaster]
MSAIHWLAGSGACGMVQTREIEYFLRAHQVKSVKIILPYAVDTDMSAGTVAVAVSASWLKVAWLAAGLSNLARLQCSRPLQVQLQLSSLSASQCDYPTHRQSDSRTNGQSGGLTKSPLPCGNDKRQTANAAETFVFKFQWLACPWGLSRPINHTLTKKASANNEEVNEPKLKAKNPKMSQRAVCQNEYTNRVIDTDRISMRRETLVLG